MKTKYQFSCVSSQFDVLWLFLVTLGLTCGGGNHTFKREKARGFYLLSWSQWYIIVTLNRYTFYLFRSIDTLSVIYFALKVKDIIRLHVNHFISTISRKLTKVGICHLESAIPLNHRPSHLHANTKFFLVTNQENFEFFFFFYTFLTLDLSLDPG